MVTGLASIFCPDAVFELEMNTEPEAYFDLVPWEVLASANHNFLMTERKRHFLRYNGGLMYFEGGGPAAYRNYSAGSPTAGTTRRRYEPCTSEKTNATVAGCGLPLRTASR